MHFDFEALIVVRTGLASEDILQLLLGVLLDDLLELRLVVFERDGLFLDGRHDEPEDELSGRVDGPVEIDGGDDRFKSIGHDGGSFSAAVLVLAFSEEEVVSEVDLLRELKEALFADGAGAQLGQSPLGDIAERVEEFVGRNEAEDRIAQELQPLVVLVSRALFVRIGGVGQRGVEEVQVRERVPQLAFQLVEGRFAFLSQLWRFTAHSAASVSAGLSSRSFFGRFSSMVAMAPLSVKEMA